MRINITKKIKLNAVQVLALGFFIVILIGGILLTLPISSKSGESTNFLDSLFTATTSVCVTGLITVDTGTHWSYFGQVIIMLLIEVGGLGFMSFATLIAILIGKKITLKERLLMQEALNTFNIQGMVRMVRYVLVFTFSVQILGALLYSTQFIPMFGLGKGIYYSIFHSISAFNNAGIDLFGHFQSLTHYSGNFVIILTTSALIIIGGLGFTVWAEVYNFKGFRKFSLHSKLVIMMTSILLVGGTILFFLFEYKNPSTLGPMDFKDKLLNAFFASVTPRTAGFNSIPTDGMTMAGRFLTILFMFIGGSPGSTAGGLKTVTFGILILTFISIIKGREDTEVFYKRIPRGVVRRSMALFIIAVGLIIMVAMILSITEVGATFEEIIYEVVSAFGTVGLTLGLTTKLTSIGKILIILTMYCGRVGPLTIALALTNKKNNNGIKYPEGKILVG
ncbi:TrkH family potassium uptake protein [Clostridium fallax]|uniref:Trk system potassium uptake protein TrkH n=1 Tax=Clostridium fallax TaxID=1533 RepID=A0A1M4WPG2_9CLOT|nr:TrkH family potassium uptake protein [Clostridium fallax]SHE83067.1 trk system potassium uptake protein TrkH [Clostridium fallax]SQB06256.1 TrkH family potassium uptake protein [Clostridium fallax]